MKLLKLLVLFSALSLLGSFNASATHVMGSDIQWKCIGKDSFTISITVYRDCNGIQLSNGAFTLASNCGTTRVTGTMSGGEDITPVCDEQCTRCDSRGCTFKYGIQKWVLTATVDLSTWRKNGCCEVTISWGQCCRNNTITTGGASNNFYVEAKLNLCQDPCDNSPQFTGDPLAIICLGRDFIYNQGATDPDVDSLGGLVDSLVYKFAEPLQTATTKTTWSSPYSYDKPIYFLGFPKATKKFPQGLHLDVNTGDLMFRPMKEEQTVVSIAIEEYRDGKRIGVTRRDIQIVVIKCPDNNPPVISGINCKEPKPENFKTTACAGEKLCFTVCTSDKDKDDTVTIGWNGGIAGATFDILNKGDRLERGRFCWTPDESKVSKFPYTFVVTAKDNACPVNGFSARSFSITVKAPPKAKYQSLVYDCGNAEFRAQKSGNINISQYLWGISGRLIANKGGKGDTVWHHYKYPGEKPYTLTLIGANGCNTIYKDTAEIPDYVNVTTSPDVTVCAGSTVNVSATASDASGTYKINWSTGDESTNAGSSTSLKVGTKDTFIVATVKDDYCDNADTTFITVNNPTKIDLGDPVRICPGEEFKFGPKILLDTFYVGTDTIVDPDSVFTYAWYQNSLTNVVSNFDSFTVKDSARYYLKLIDSLQCSFVDSVDLFVNPNRNWLPDDQIICINDTATFKIKETSPKSQFDWWASPQDTAGLPIFTGETYEDNPTASKFYGIRWSETLFGLSCEAYDSVFAKVNPLPDVEAKSIGDVCESEDPFSLILRGAPLGGSWYDNDPDKDFVQFGRFYPRIAKADGEKIKTHWLYYTYTDGNGCTDYDSTPVKVKPTPRLELADDQKMCTSEDPKELDQFVVKEKGGKWITTANPSPGVVEVGGQYFFDPKAVSDIQGAYPLIYTYTDNSGAAPFCSNTDTLIMNLIAVPKVDAGILDSICKDALPVSLTNGETFPTGITGKWHYIGLDNTIDSTDWEEKPDQFDPSAHDVGKHYWAYRYRVPNSQCYGVDTLSIGVNPLPNPQSTTVWDQIDGENKICITDLKDLTGNTSEDGELYTDYFWTGRGAREVKPLTYQFEANISGEGSSELTYTVTNIYGCNNRINETVIVDGTPEVSFTNEKACVGDTVFLNITVLNASELRWTTTGGGSFDGPGSLNTYYLPDGPDKNDIPFTITAHTINDKNVCPEDSSVEKIKVFPLADVKFEVDELVCGPSLVIFKNESEVSQGSMREFHLDYGDGTEETFRGVATTFSHVYGVKGDANTYNPVLTVTTDQGCVSSNTKEVVTLQTPIAAFNPRPGTTTIIQPDIYFENLTTKDIPGKSSFLWNFDDFSIRTPDGGSSTERHPSYRYTDVGEYDVMLVATNTYETLTCVDTVIRTIEVNPEIRIFIPNAFSPDNKGVAKNNFFKPIVSDVNDYSIQVFSRWGELMWETQELEESWDGTKAGVACKSDVYLYVVKASNEAGKDFEFTGTVTLIR